MRCVSVARSVEPSRGFEEAKRLMGNQFKAATTTYVVERTERTKSVKAAMAALKATNNSAIAFHRCTPLLWDASAYPDHS
jgi:hypothetical protein